MTEKNIQILAPAGGYEQLLAAVRCGADGVYLGLPQLNARINAANFTPEQFAEGLAFCRERGVKVLLTLNTLVLDSELETAKGLVEAACAHGVDGIIVQDLACAELAFKIAPHIELHASTQMAVHNLDGAKQLEQMGFSQVVLARELSLSEIGHISANTSLKTEVFVHGALCMSVSGNCYLSSVIGQRSGNRGRCAQPCRLPFSGPSQKSQYSLSLKDLSAICKIEALRAAGVAALKIEGRMKRPEYVAAAVTACAAARRGEPYDAEALQSVFSRSGFTLGYLDAKRGPEMFGSRRKEDVTSADSALLSSLSRLYENEAPLVGLDAVFIARDGEPSQLEVTDGVFTAAQQCEAPSPSLTKPLTAESAARNLEKTGGTPYYIKKLSCSIGEGLFLPASALNALRRDAVAQLAEKRKQPTTRPPKPYAFEAVEPAPKHSPPKIYGFLQSAAQFSRALFERCDLVALSSPADITRLAAEGYDTSKFALMLPRMNYGAYDAGAAQGLQALGVKKAVCPNLGALRFAREAGFEPVGDFTLNIFNSLALKKYKELGLAEAVLSIELSLQTLKTITAAVPSGIIAYGYQRLMTLRNCPMKSFEGCEKCKAAFFTDRTGRRFKFVCDNQSSNMLNCEPLVLYDRLDELSFLSFLALDFTIETAEQAAEICAKYRTGAAKPATEYTRGLYYRGAF